MSSLWLDKYVTWWVSHWLTGGAQRVIVNGVTTGWQPVTGGVLLGSISGPVLFSGSVNELDAGLSANLTSVHSSTKLGGAVDSLECREALQRGVDKSKSWAVTNSMKFNNSKCEIVFLGWGSPSYTYRLGDVRL